MDKKKLYNDAIRLWGIDAQIDMAVEEASEFIKSICKVKRTWHELEIVNFFEEMADLEIMLEQMKQLFGCHSVVEEKKAKKLERLQKKIKREAEKKNGNQSTLH